MNRIAVRLSPLLCAALVACGGPGQEPGADYGYPEDTAAQSEGLAADVEINEVLANEAGSDTNGEFVEILNTGTTAISLAGWKLSDSTGVRHTFASGTSLAAGQVVVVFGAAAGIPAGTPNAIGSSTGSLQLGNSGDSVILKDASGATIASLTYSSSLSGTDGVSANRSPDGSNSSSTYVLHTTLSSTRNSSPGLRANGTAWGTVTEPPDAGVPDAGQPGGNGTRIRVMAANITSGNLQSYDPGEGIRIFQGLDPDVVMLQEFNYGTNSATDLRGFVNTAFGTSYSYYRQPSVQIANGVVSRYPILESGLWDDTAVDNRDFVYARIDIPGSKDLWAVSVHLLTASASVRNGEATALRAQIQSKIPAGDYLVIGGDFNTDSRSEACMSTLGSVVRTGSPYPEDQNANGNTNASRAKPYDWVVADPDLDPLQVATQVGARSYPKGLVFDSRVYTPLTEVSPVLFGDSSATNMQHMAVVKDYQLP